MGLAVTDLLGRLIFAAGLGAVVGWDATRPHGEPVPGPTRSSRSVRLCSPWRAPTGSGDVARANVDPARIAAQVATGVGFIGAGAIIRNGTSVHGVTTTARLWLAASLGVASAAGGYLAALVTTPWPWASWSRYGRRGR
jgi:putative Mg2+ transporter-C (MgtC) family protein